MKKEELDVQQFHAAFSTHLKSIAKIQQQRPQFGFANIYVSVFLRFPIMQLSVKSFHVVWNASFFPPSAGAPY